MIVNRDSKQKAIQSLQTQTSSKADRTGFEAEYRDEDG